MHPILFEIPIPRLLVPLAPAAMIILAIALAVAIAGWRSGTRELSWIGGTAAAVALVAALRFRGESTLLGPIPLYGYGVSLAAGLGVGWLVAHRRLCRLGIERNHAAASGLLAIVGGLLGARVLFLAQNPPALATPADVFAFGRGGLAIYGAWSFGAVAAWVYLRRHRSDVLVWLDAATPGAALGLVFGRVGCYLAGCDYGRPLGEGAPRWLAALGTFPRWPEGKLPDASGSPAFVDHVERYDLARDAAVSLPVHPTQLYDGIAALSLFAVALLAPRAQRFHGQAFLVFVLGYGAWRLVLEQLRDDPERGTWGPMTPGQWIAGATLVAATICWPVLSARAHRLRSENS